MVERIYDFIVVGSGAGGATLACELTRQGKSVLVVERGHPHKKMGTVTDSLTFYDVHPLTQMPVESREGVQVWRTFMAGGSTVVSCGNGVRCLETELAALGVDLKEPLDEVEKEMGVAAIDPALQAESSNRLGEAARKLGYQLAPMPKFIDPAKCQKCGQCVFGCRYGAKWTAVGYLEEAQSRGAQLLYDTRVREVLIENGRATGVQATGAEGNLTLRASQVILAAGGLETPVILQHSGIPAGEGLFVDLMTNTYGLVAEVDALHEPTMALVNHEFHASKGFIVSPFVNHSRLGRVIELGVQGAMLPSQRLVGMMTKIVDESAGRVYPDGTFSKPVTARDQSRLDAGAALIKELLREIGTDPASFITSRAQGAHPGGTAAIGRVVDRHLQTRVEGLFVCDCSVLPEAPGLPPILTLVALAKRLARTLV